jgi:tetratricopeptide (TPR) repeat protein
MADHPRMDDLRRRVQKDPASIAFAQLAEELRRAGDSQESVDVCRAGLSIHPGYLSARVTLGRALLDLGHLDDALTELQLVREGAPDNLAAIRGLAEIHHKRGALVEALAQYKTALSLAPNDPELEQTVADLSRRVEPQLGADKGGLSLQQMESELTIRVPVQSSAPALPVLAGQVILDPAPAVAVSDPVHATAPMQPPGAEWPATAYATPAVGVAPDRSQRTVAALEQWLSAIHGTRADRRA